VEIGDGIGVGGQPEREGRQAEGRLVAEAAEREQSLAIETRRRCERADVAVHELLVEDLVTGRHRRVGREHGGAANLLESRLRLHAVGHERADALDLEKRRVSLVQVEHGGLDPERREGTHPAHAEQELLPDPMLAVTAVEGVREPVDLEQVERHWH
jgi:hypothetical protein